MGGREYRRMMKNLPKVDIMGQKLHDNPIKGNLLIKQRKIIRAFSSWWFTKSCNFSFKLLGKT
jgi:hypothetical protein